MGLVGMGLWETGLPRRDGRDAVGQLSFVSARQPGEQPRLAGEHGCLPYYCGDPRCARRKHSICSGGT